MSFNEPSYNIVTFGKKSDNFIISIERGIVGTFLNTVPQYLHKGSVVFLHCHSLIWGIARISSEYIHDEKIIWKDKVYPHRFYMEVLHLTNNPLSLVKEHYNDRLREEFGNGWAFKFIFAPKPLPESIGSDIYNNLMKRESASWDVVYLMLEKMGKTKR